MKNARVSRLKKSVTTSNPTATHDTSLGIASTYVEGCRERKSEVASIHPENIPTVETHRKALRKKPIAVRLAFLTDKRGPDECHQFRGNIDSHGYGRIGLNGKMELAHRVAWEVANGEPLGSRLACHRCVGNRSCVNPAHIYAGTHADNNRDTFEQGRTTRGEQSSQAKLTAAQVLEQRREYRAGDRNYERMGRELGVTGRAIAYAISGEHWKHLDSAGGAL